MQTYVIIVPSISASYFVIFSIGQNKKTATKSQYSEMQLHLQHNCKCSSISVNTHLSKTVLLIP